MLQTEGQRTADRRQEHQRTAERRETRTAAIPAMAMQALLAGARLESLPAETVRQLSRELGNSGLAELLQGPARPEAPEWPAPETALETPPAAVQPVQPQMVQPPAGFGGGEA